MKAIRKFSLYIKSFLLVFISISIVTFSIDANIISAANVSLDLKISSYAKSKGNEAYLKSTDVLNYGDVLEITMSVSNKKEISSNISVSEKEGIGFFAYYEGVLKIDGKNASKSEYNEFLKSGVSRQLSKKSTVFVLDVKAIGSHRNTLSIDMKISAPSVTIGDDQETYEHTFHATSNFEKKQHQVNLYDNDSLLSSILVENGGSIATPTLAMVGYDFLGFNTQADGNGEYYHKQKITSSMNLFAMFKRKELYVRYYIGDSLYEEQKVLYGNAAPFITLDNKGDNRFLGWSKSLDSITENINVFAIYEEQDMFEGGISYRLDDFVDGSDNIYKIDGFSIKKDSNKILVVMENVKVSIKDNVVLKSVLVALPILIALGIVYKYTAPKRRRRRKYE